MAETLSAVIERVTFHNPDTGFAVLRVQARGRRGLVTVVGNLPSVVAGEYLEATGEWVQDREHGEQFKAAELRCTPPHTKDGIEKYLGSGLVKGIGPHFARKIVAVFGERTLDVIDESPAFLKEVKGIGAKRLQLIRESWHEQKAVRGIIVFLQSHGLGTARAVRIYKTYGDRAVELVRANPYRLATDIWGVGFKTADDLAERLGIDRHSPLRARAALRFVLQELTHEGHVGYPEEAVVAKTGELTHIPPAILTAAVEAERLAGDVVREPGGDEPWLYLKPLFLSELGIARALTKLRSGGHPLPALELDKALSWVEQKMGLELAPLQRQAITQAAREKVLVITGGPGTGKSTLVRGILEIFTTRKQRVALCAPTGRAAKRLTETTGREAKTIHRLLEFDPAFGAFKRDANQRLDLDLLVVDEASMVDVVLLNQLLRALPTHACLVLVGDVDQLPSVGAGRVLGDIIASGTVPVVRLTEIFRQAGQSWIVRAAHAIKNGELPQSAPPGQGDFYFVEANEPAAVTERILTMVRDRIPQRFGLDPFRDVQVLTPMNRTELGSQALNLRLQEALNPPRGGAEVERFGWKFRAGDKVIQTQNNYKKEVFNGDIGRLRAIDPTNREVVVDFDGKEVVYDFGELDELALAYAMTVHKCVAGYGLASVEGEGLVPVREVRVGQSVQTGGRQARRVLDHVNTGEREIVQIRTRCGYVIDVSEEHPILVASAEVGPHFRPARDLHPGLFACIDRTVLQGCVQELPPITCDATQKPQKRLTVQTTLTEGFAWALGVIVGDGCYRDHRDGMIDVTNQDCELIDRYRAIMEEFGLTVTVRPTRNYYRIYFNSKPLRKWFASWGLDYSLGPQKQTPSVVFRSPPEVRAAYLRGLFDTDGSVGRINIRFTSASETLAREVQTLLLSLGIVACFSSQGPRHHKVTVSGPSVPVFQDRIGFVVEKKCQRLVELVARTRKGKTNRDVIPFGRGLIREYKTSLPSTRGRKGEGFCPNRTQRYQFVMDLARGAYRLTYAHLRKIAQRAVEIGRLLPGSLQAVLDSNYFYDEITAVERPGTTTCMYDLEVEDRHAFVVNGFVCHNSQGSEYPAVILPLHTQHFMMLQRNLFYTGVTRGKKLVVVVGTRKALEMAVQRQDMSRRCSALCRRLQEAGPEGEEQVGE